MLINLFLKKPILYKEIEKYQYGALFGIASYSLYTINFVSDFTFINNLMFLFLTGETFFLPYNRIDSIIHHLLGIGFICYPKFYSIPLNTIIPHSTTFLRVETSSIFLCSSYFLKEKLKSSKNKILPYLSNASNVLLITSFLKYRIYDFMGKILLNSDFYNDMLVENTNSHLYLYTTTFSFFLLNSYWFSKMCKIALKMF
jgi:hypothetical protein